MEIKDGKINFGLRKPLLSSLHQPVSRLREIPGNTPTLKQKHGEVKLSWGIVFQRRALKPLEGLVIILLHSGTNPIQKTELKLGLWISLIRRSAKPARGFSGIAIHAQSKLKRARDLELLLKISGFGAFQ